MEDRLVPRNDNLLMAQGYIERRQHKTSCHCERSAAIFHCLMNVRPVNKGMDGLLWGKEHLQYRGMPTETFTPFEVHSEKM